ncbi:hypothetical protein [Inhella gelatinilytica]|uniref:Uncharacterized protein n=1 Tax=Inhella gelatinilytica TaxID=2795030 RepID=A0A931IZH0_9BURK|nr:hypothetical protein [Inhella gelatinilytica]MBH9553964.1 hypothetical protein [Inhella gelatinilytica]
MQRGKNPTSLNNKTRNQGMGLSPVAAAVASLYGEVVDFNAFIDRHIDSLKASANATISATGRVLESAKFGFGLGYLSSVTIIAVGQFLLGNPLAAATTVASATAMANPIAMTCAAVGAIVYGWNALSDAEREGVLANLSAGLDIGIELIKAIIAFVIRTTKELLDSEALKEFKSFIAEKATLFGRRLSDVTRQALDTLSDSALAARRAADLALASTASAAAVASESVGRKWRTWRKDGKSAPPSAALPDDSTRPDTVPTARDQILPS